MTRLLLFALGIIILLAAEILRVYFIMPFSGSQQHDTIGIAYFLGRNIDLFRIGGIAMIAWPVISYFRTGPRRARITVSLLAAAYLAVYYLFNFEFVADKMFYQPSVTTFLPPASSGVPATDLVLGVALNGEAKAYPIEIIGYHHQVRDLVGNVPVMITYCTVCRTGRVFRPEVNGKPEKFRLVGMDHFNAMFEDASTKSWWRQATGEAIAGPLKGKALAEVPAEQMRLDAWIRQHPDTKIMQPDTLFRAQYEHLKNYDEGRSKGRLTRADSLAWKDKSWIVGIKISGQARAYDWRTLVAAGTVNDTLAGVPVLLAMEPDSVSFHAFRRDTLHFERDHQAGMLRDQNTGSLWNWAGKAERGSLAGSQLQPVQGYQEFWHSWRTFQPNTTEFDMN